MPKQTPQRRGKWLFAFICLTGTRVSALSTLRIGHDDLKEKSVSQSTREDSSKNGKSIDMFFAKEFEVAEAGLVDWFGYLEEKLHLGPDDPLYRQELSIIVSNI